MRSTRGRGASAAEAEGGVEDVCGAAARERGFPGTHADTRLWVGRVTGASPCLQSSKHGLPPCVPRLLRAACRRCLSRCARQLRPTASLAAPDRFTALRLRSVCFKPHRSELDGRPHDAALARTIRLRQSRVDRLASSDFDKMGTSLCVLMLSVILWQVERTKTRPLAAGDITQFQAAGFLGLQVCASGTLAPPSPRACTHTHLQRFVHVLRQLE